MLGLLGRSLNLSNPINRASHFARGLMGLWLPFNQGPYYGGARLLDMCGNFHATLSGSPTWGGGLQRPGATARLILDGSDDYASVPDDDRLDFDGSVRDWSIGICFRRKSHTTNDGLLAKKAGTSSANPGYMWMLTDGGDFSTFTWHDTGASSRPLTGTTAITDPTVWYDLAVTYSLSETRGRHYHNGVQDYTDNISDIGDCGNAQPLNFGVDAGATSPGDIDIAYAFLYYRLLSAQDLVDFRLESLRGYPSLLNWNRLPWVDVPAAAGGGGNTKRRDLMLLGVGC